MLAAILAAMLQAGVAPPPAAAQGSDVVVRGERPRSKREEVRAIDRQIDTILPRTPIDQPLARYQTAVCPGVMGLVAASAQAVVDRIGIVADELGLDVGEPGCAPNLLVVVTADARAATRRLAARRQGNFWSQSLADMRRLHAEAGSARGWTEVEMRSRDGEGLTRAVPTAPDLADFGVPILSVPTANRTALGFRRDIVSAVVMIDAAAATRRDVVQIADYAAMRGLAGIRADAPRQGRTILAAFTPDGDATAPPTLTEVDWGILRGLYAGTGNRPAGIKRGAMIRDILAADIE